jgi:hypothetical protein
MEKDLAVNGQPISSNNSPFCIRCGLLIVKANDSGWESFTEDGITTQPICIFCEAKESGAGPKAQEKT